MMSLKMNNVKRVKVCSLLHPSLLALLLLLLVLGMLAGCGADEPKKLKIGDKSPDFSVLDLEGKEINTASLLGKPLVLRFFLPDCKYCKADTIVFNEYYQQYRAKGLQIVYLSASKDLAEVKAFVSKVKVEFPVVLDGDRKISSLFNINIFPQTLLLNPAHEIIGAIMGGVGRAELDDLLGQYLKAYQVKEDERCSVCGMFVAKYPEWLAQIHHADGTVKTFDGVKDMMVYNFNPEQYGGSARETIDEIWVRDHYTLEWFDGRNAFFVVGSDLTGPMGHEFIPFLTRAAAEGFLKDHHGSTILSFGEITSEQVESMRHGSRMKE